MSKRSKQIFIPKRLRVDEDMKKKIDDLAEHEERTIQGQMVHLLTLGLKAKRRELLRIEAKKRERVA